MSRSAKKTWGWTDHKSPNSRLQKRFANKKVRRTSDIPSGGAYKRLYCSYTICDYRFLYFHMGRVLEHLEKLGGKEYKFYQK
jgi:hypothetical protein